MELKKVNWIGLVSGIMLIAVILFSLYSPWWQLKIGDVGYANFSLSKTDFSFLGMTFLIPVLTAINVSCLLLLSISATLMLVYSVNPTKKYSKQLLCWSYTKPPAILITFIVAIVVFIRLASVLAQQYAQIHFTLPIMGTAMIQIPSELLGEFSGVQISVAVSGAFQWTFYLAIVAAVMCIVTRLFYEKGSSTPNPVVDAIETN